MYFTKKRINLESANIQTLFNVLGTSIRGGISYLTMPIFTRLLGAEQYGFFSIYLSWCGVFACFMGLQCGSSLATRYYKYDDYDDYKSGLFSFCILMCVGITFAAILFVKQIGRLIELPSIIVVIMLFEAITTFVMSYASNSWIYEKKAQKNMMVALINAVMSVSISIVLIYMWTSKDLYIARIIGSFVPVTLLSVIISIGIFRKGSVKLNREYIRYGLSFGIPIIFHMLSQYVLTHSDRLMMQKMGISMAEIGVYSFAYSFSMILLTILLALGNGWTPFLYDGLKERKYEETNKSVNNYVEFFTILCCGFLLVAKEFGEIFGSKEFWPGIKLIPIFVFSVYCIFIYQFAVNYESYLEKPKYIAMMTISAAAINIILNWIFIPHMGILGASIATFVSYLFLAIFHMRIIFIWKYDKYPLKIKSILTGAMILFLSALLFYLLYDLWMIRWLLAVGLGGYLVVFVIKRRGIF